MRVCCSVFTASALLLAGACAPLLPQPTAADAAAASQLFTPTSLADLARGRDVYARKCTGCHAAKAPGSLPPEAWPKRVDEMAAKVHLGAADREILLRYLVTVSSRTRQG